MDHCNVSDAVSPEALAVLETKSHQTLAGLKLTMQPCAPILLSLPPKSWD